MKMSRSAACLALMALMLVTVNASADNQCKDCRGDILVHLADTVEQVRECAFNSKHHYLVTIKLRVLETLSEELEKLYISGNNLVSAKCKSLVQYPECETLVDDQDALSLCYVDKIKKLARKYRDLEACHMEILLPSLTDLIHKILAGTIAGTKELHSSCHFE